MPELRWQCPTCILDFSEPFCSSCAADLTAHPFTESSERVPGVRSPAEIARVVREFGVQAALQIANQDAVYSAMKPGKASL